MYRKMAGNGICVGSSLCGYRDRKFTRIQCCYFNYMTQALTGCQCNRRGGCCIGSRFNAVACNAQTGIFYGLFGGVDQGYRQLNDISADSVLWQLCRNIEGLD